MELLRKPRTFFIKFGENTLPTNMFLHDSTGNPRRDVATHGEWIKCSEVCPGGGNEKHTTDWLPVVLFPKSGDQLTSL